jgi:hypothetical protein
LWELAGTTECAAVVKQRDRAVSSTLTLAIEHITGRYSSACVDSATAAAAVQLRLQCTPLWPVLQAVLQLQYMLVQRNSRRTDLLIDRGLIAGSAQSRALRQAESVIKRLRPATACDLQLRGYEHLGDSVQLLVPQSSSSLRTDSGFASMTSMGLPPPKLSGKPFWFTVPKQYASADDIDAARAAFTEVLGPLGAATAGGDFGLSVFITIADLLQGSSIEIGRGAASALYVVHERLRRRAQSSVALLERRLQQLQSRKSSSASGSSSSASGSSSNSSSSDNSNSEALLLDEQLADSDIAQLTLSQVQHELVKLKDLIAEINSIMKHKQRALHITAIRFIMMKYAHYITAPSSSWMTGSSKARLLGFGTFKSKLKQASVNAIDVICCVYTASVHYQCYLHACMHVCYITRC